LIVEANCVCWTVEANYVWIMLRKKDAWKVEENYVWIMVWAKCVWAKAKCVCVSMVRVVDV
jgi:hypothetical protein